MSRMVLGASGVQSLRLRGFLAAIGWLGLGVALTAHLVAGLAVIGVGSGVLAAVARLPRRDRAGQSGDGERGAGMVELALAIPMFVTIMLGTITSGLALNDDLQLTHAAREGARYGATVPDIEVFATGDWSTNVRDVVIERFGPGLAAADVCVALVTGSPPSPISVAHTTKGDGSACYDDSSSGVTDSRVQVTVEKDSFIDTAFYRRNFVLTSEATAKHESNG